MKKLISIKNELLTNGLSRILSGTVVVTVALIINGVFSYLLQLFLGRTLTVQDYGTFNALLSLFYILSVPATVLTISIVKISSDLFGKKKLNELTKLFWDLSKNAFYLGILITLVLFFFRNVLSNYLNIEKPMLFLTLGFYIIGTYIVLPPRSYLRGMLLFNKFAAFSIVAGFFRFAVPILLVYLGYGVGGAYIGLFISLVLAFLLALPLLTKEFKKDNSVNIKYLYKKIITFSVPVLLIQLCIMMLTNVDLVLVKKYFTALETGYYAGVVTLGKIILFGAGAVAMVMFPEISALRSAGKNYLKRFKFFVIFQLLVLIPALLIFILFPKIITVMFFGKQFINSIQYLPLFSIFISLYVCASFMIQFFLAIEKTNVYLFLIIPVITQFILINLYHSSLYDVIWINIISTAILLVSLIFYLYKIHKESAQ